MRVTLGREQQECASMTIEINSFKVKWTDLTNQNRYLDGQNKELSTRIIDLETRL